MKILIVGGGQTGSYLANLLSSNGHEVIVIEQRENVFAKLKNELPKEMLLFGNGTDPETLEAAGIGSANVVAAVTGKDEVNLVVSTLSKMEFGVPRVVARVNNPKNAWLFTASMGVDVGVNQADLMAHFVVEEMNLREMFTILKLNRGNCSIVQIEVNPAAAAAGKRVKELGIPQKAVLISITRGHQTIIPRGDTQILAGDSILAFTDTVSRDKLNQILG